MSSKDLIVTCEDLLAVLAAAEARIRVLSATQLSFPAAMALHRGAATQARALLEEAGFEVAVLGLTDVGDDDTDELLHRVVKSTGAGPPSLPSVASPSERSGSRRRRRRLFSTPRVLVADGEEGPLLQVGGAPSIPLDDGPEGSADDAAPLNTEEEPIFGEVPEEEDDSAEIPEILISVDDEIVDDVPARYLEDNDDVTQAEPQVNPEETTQTDDDEPDHAAALSDAPSPSGDDALVSFDDAGSPLVSFEDDDLFSDEDDDVDSHEDNGLVSFEDPKGDAPHADNGLVSFADDGDAYVQFDDDPGIEPVHDDPASALVETEVAARNDDETTLVLDASQIEAVRAEAVQAAAAVLTQRPPVVASDQLHDDEEEGDDDTEESAAPLHQRNRAAGVRAGTPIRKRPERRDAAAKLYAAAASIPKIRDSSGPKPRAAAIQLQASPDAGQMTGTVLGDEEEDEPIAIGAVEDYDEDYDLDLDDDQDGGFRLNVEEYEDAAEEEVEDDEVPEEVAAPPEPEPEPAGPSRKELQAQLDRARAAAEGGDIDAGVNLYSDVLDADPDNVDACIGRGRLYLDLGDYARAMSDFTVAEDMAPDSPEPQVATGDLYFARKEYRKAIEYFDAALTTSPDHAMAYCRRGISHYYRKNYKQALDDLTKAQKLGPDIPNIRTYVSMAKKKKK